MESKTITEGNRVIAEFMQKEEDYDEHGSWQKFQYHTSWDWLMPCVDKIEEMGYYFTLEKDWIFINRFNDNSGQIVRTNCFTHKKGKIYGVYQAVLEFITWYNSQNDGK